MTVNEVLRAARAKIEDDGRWGRHLYAVDAFQQAVAPTDPTAARWCAAGAIECVTGGDREAYQPAKEALREAIKLISIGSDMGIAGFNDSTDHAGILEVMDLAIAATNA